jgi:hypothetical protein
VILRAGELRVVIAAVREAEERTSAASCATIQENPEPVEIGSPRLSRRNSDVVLGFRSSVFF